MPHGHSCLLAVPAFMYIFAPSEAKWDKKKEKQSGEKSISKRSNIAYTMDADGPLWSGRYENRTNIDDIDDDNVNSKRFLL